MLSFVPTHLGCFDRAGLPLLNWFRDWLSEESLQPLTPEEWFTTGHDIVGGSRRDGLWFPCYQRGVRLWAPPPAAARQAVEQLRMSRHKRKESLHVFVCPRVMAYAWRKMLLKESDFMFYLPAGTLPFWGKEHHEPLLIAIAFPYCRHAPWKLGGCPRFLELERDVRRLLKEDKGDPRALLLKLCKLARDVESLSPELVRQLLYHRKPNRVPHQPAHRSGG